MAADRRKRKDRNNCFERTRYGICVTVVVVVLLCGLTYLTAKLGFQPNEEVSVWDSFLRIFGFASSETDDNIVSKILNIFDTSFIYLCVSEAYESSAKFMNSFSFDVIYHHFTRCCDKFFSIFDRSKHFILYFVLVLTLLVPIWILFKKRFQKKSPNLTKSARGGRVTFRGTVITFRQTFVLLCVPLSVPWEFIRRGTVITFRQTFVTAVLLCVLLSVPWEFIRLYQIAVSKRAAVIYAGIPSECIPDDLSVLQSLKSWIIWQISWIHEPCEKYHHALLVDPLWEVTPIVVLVSTFTRCILHPMEMIVAGLGRCLKMFLNEIPSPWQPVVMTTIVLLFTIVFIMACRYRISFPFFKIEPKTPNASENGATAARPSLRRTKVNKNIDKGSRRKDVISPSKEVIYV